MHVLHPPPKKKRHLRFKWRAGNISQRNMWTCSSWLACCRCFEKGWISSVYLGGSHKEGTVSPYPDPDSRLLPWPPFSDSIRFVVKGLSWVPHSVFHLSFPNAGEVPGLGVGNRSACWFSELFAWVEKWSLFPGTTSVNAHQQALKSALLAFGLGTHLSSSSVVFTWAVMDLWVELKVTTVNT